jgi:2-polyprenyl-3-methyl-5-hydroxy-6-metoxy-1,4-benzoquinol methylase
MKQWYETLFENFANSYEQEPYTKGTIGEVDFIEKEVSFDKAHRILDIGCGTGRHAIELAKRGYSVVGVDLSAAQLDRARQNAMKENVSPRFFQADARALTYKNEFDLVTIICEGAFPLMENDEMNFAILRNAKQALRPRGRLILTTLNGLFPLFHSVRDFVNGNYESDPSQNHSFDLLTFRDRSEYTFVDDSGISHVVQCNERYYVPSEVTWLLKSLGFTRVDFFGCDMGAWSREKRLTTNDFEMLVVAETQ